MLEVAIHEIYQWNRIRNNTVKKGENQCEHCRIEENYGNFGMVSAAGIEPATLRLEI
jgi:hypothetical protein